jgi:hypothetical protein
MAQTSTDTVDIGGVFSDAFAALRQNWATYLILAPIFVGIPAAAATWEVEQLVAQHVLSTTNPVGAFLIGYLRSFPVGIAGFALQGAVMVGAAAFLDGRRASFGDCLMAGLRNWPVLLVLNLMRGAAIVVGYLLFIIPGIVLNLVWYVAGPVQVIEGGSPLASLRRSADLTRGRRWSLFGLSIIVGVFGFLIGLASGFIAGFVVGFLKPFGVYGLQAEVLAYPLTYMTAYPLGSAVAAAVYRQLNGGRGQTDALVEIFA